MLSDLWKDLRYSIRALKVNPGLTFAAVGSLALGLGLNITLFSLVDRLLWKPLPVSKPGELVTLTNSTPRKPAQLSFSYPDYRDLRDGNELFSGLVGHSLMFASVSIGERPELVVGEVVTGNYFNVLGINPLAGRALAPEDDQPGAAPVVVLGESLFARRFGREASAVGRTIKIRGTPYTIVGVMPASFPGLLPGMVAQMWVPAGRLDDVSPAGWLDSTGPASSAPPLERRGFRWMIVKGRLEPGATLAAAKSNVAALMAGLAREYPETNEGRTGGAVPASSVRLYPNVDRALAPAGTAVMVMVSLVLLVACANVANMLLARATGRRREIGVRLAIGASPGRLVRQLMVESLVLSLLGGALGLLLAIWITGTLARLRLPLPVSLDLDLSLDARLIGFCLLAVVVTAVVFGLVPALRSVRPELVTALKDEAASSTPLARFGLRNVLVIGQLAVSFVLLVAAGLLLKSLSSSLSTSPGFEMKGITIASMDLDTVRWERTRVREFYRQALERMSALPEVESVALATRIPLTVNVHSESLFLDGRDLGGDKGGMAVDVSRVSPGYLSLLRVPLLAGRDFSSSDVVESPRVAIVSRAAAQLLWPGKSAVGERFRSSVDGPSFEVIGVAEDYKVRSTGEAPRPMVHFAFDQRPVTGVTLLARSRAQAADLTRAFEREIGALAPDLVLIENKTMAEVLAVNLLPARLGSVIFGGFGALALFLAAVGLYGVVAYSTRQRTREIGIRMAIGSERSGVLALVLKQGARLAAIGLGAGLVLAVVITQLFAKMFPGLGAFEPLVYLGAAAVLAAVVLVANFIPARQASRLDPLVALRRG